jgi:putative ABC transport system ATP-binding protein
MLLLSGVHKRFGPRAVVDGLDLALAPGEFVAIVGESGAGKSTLLNLIAGLDTADAGRVEVDGQNIALLDDAARTRLRRTRIGFVFQAFYVLPHLTVAQNVELPLVLLGVAADLRAQRSVEMLMAVGLAGRAASLPRELSGGELQRVAVARALAHRPALVLADEPTGNLDPDHAGQVIDLLAATVRAHKAAAILVTHSRQAARRADRVLRLEHGRLQPEGSSET